MENTVSNPETRAMTTEQFHELREYKVLTPQQRAWADHFILSGDPNSATVAAYPDSTTPTLLTFQLQANSRVMNALNKYFRIDDKQAFLNELRYTIRKSKGVAKVEAQKLYAQLAFGVPEEPEADADTPDAARSPTLARVNAEPQSKPSQTKRRYAVGDPVFIDGLKREVLAVDSDGQITEVSDEVIQ
jgi:hypothetical protein